MNDTTKWIMIILLLLLIAAAVFMLLRSPGKDDGEGTDTAVGRDTDRDGVPEAREDRIGPSGGTADRGVYDQEADARAAAAEDTREPAAVEDAGTAAPVIDSPYDSTTGTAVPGAVPPVGEPAPVEAREEPAPVEPAPVEVREEPTPVEPAPVEVREEPTPVEVREEPPTRQEADDSFDDSGATAGAAGVAGATAAGAAGVTAAGEERPGDVRYRQDPLYEDEALDRGTAATEPAAELDTSERAAGTSDVDATTERGPEYPVGEESTTYRAADGGAVVVGEEQPTDTDARNWTDTHAGPDTVDQGVTTDADTATQGGDTAYAGWDAPPADTGTGAPQTADEIVESRSATAGAGTAAESQVTDTGLTETAADQGAPVAPVYTEAAYGPGSAEPLEDGSGPAGWEVKGNIGSMLFHTPESPSWDAVRAEVWFENEEAARAAGFAHWDRRRR